MNLNRGAINPLGEDCSLAQWSVLTVSAIGDDRRRPGAQSSCNQITKTQREIGFAVSAIWRHCAGIVSIVSSADENHFHAQKGK